MKTKYLLSLLLLPALLVACNDDEKVQVPASFEVQSINYFFEGGDGVQTYDIVTDTFEYYNDSDVEQQVDWEPKQSDYKEYTFTVTIPDNFNWGAEKDTLWVYDISLYDGYPSNVPSPIPFLQGTTLWPDGVPSSLRITVPPHTRTTLLHIENFQEITASYILELENTTTGEPLLVKGKMKKKWVYTSTIDNGDEAEVTVL